MGIKALSIISIIFLLACTSGCMRPQIIDPFSDGFSEDEYLVIKITDTDQIGQLWEAVPEFDAKGKALPLHWRGTIKLLFPQSNTVNRVIPFSSQQERYAFENVGSSTKFTAAAIVDASASTDSAYKYESKSQEGRKLDMQSLRFAPTGADFIRKRLEEDRNYQFAYLSAIYTGTAFVEVLTNTKAAGGGGYAAFQLGSDYYVSQNKHYATTGPIIYQLTPIDPLEVGVSRPGVPPVTVPKSNIQPLTPLTHDQIETIKDSLPAAFRQMIE